MLTYFECMYVIFEVMYVTILFYVKMINISFFLYMRARMKYHISFNSFRNAGKFLNVRFFLLVIFNVLFSFTIN